MIPSTNYLQTSLSRFNADAAFCNIVVYPRNYQTEMIRRTPSDTMTFRLFMARPPMASAVIQSHAVVVVGGGGQRYVQRIDHK